VVNAGQTVNRENMYNVSNDKSITELQSLHTIGLVYYVSKIEVAILTARRDLINMHSGLSAQIEVIMPQYR